MHTPAWYVNTQGQFRLAEMRARDMVRFVVFSFHVISFQRVTCFELCVCMCACVFCCTLLRVYVRIVYFVHNNFVICSLWLIYNNIFTRCSCTVHISYLYITRFIYILNGAFDKCNDRKSRINSSICIAYIVSAYVFAVLKMIPIWVG